MNTSHKLWIVVIVALVVAAGYIILTKPTKLGLDLSGGVRFLLQAEPNHDVPQITNEAMDSLQNVIDKRVNPTGTEENLVQKVGNNRLLVEIPGATDPEQAKQVIGKTGDLQFKAFDPQTNQFVSTGLSGKDLASASTQPDVTPGNYAISLTFNNAGTDKFFEITRKLAPIHGKLGIFFDDKKQSDPYVNEAIAGGKAQITGHFTKEQSDAVVNILKAGSLPVNVSFIEESSVGPTLGHASLERSKLAGIIGVGIVMIFMLLYYRLPGLFADIALLIYATLLFGLIKLTPSSLSLAGIAGIILSVGMAVDANILIFERTREELKLGRTVGKAVELGFERAFTSIFDSNMTTIIVCLILYLMGTGLVKGFAFSLALGVIVSFFTALVVTRALMSHFLPMRGHFTQPFWFGLKPSDLPSREGV